MQQIRNEWALALREKDFELQRVGQEANQHQSVCQNLCSQIDSLTSQLNELQAQNTDLTQHTIRVEEHERILNSELQKAEKQAHDKFVKLQSQMEQSMTKAFEEWITESHQIMQLQIKDVTSRLQ